jgi:hypothetical protein
VNDAVIITSSVVTDDLMRSLRHRSHVLAKVTDAAALTAAAVAAEYVHDNHERASWVLTGLGYLSARLSISRFNRRLHSAAGWLVLTVETLGELLRGWRGLYH